MTLKGEVHSSHMKQQLLEFIKSREHYNIVDSIIALPQESLGEKRHGVISVSVANLRSKPGHGEELVTQVLMGTPVTLLKFDDGWFLVQTPDDYLGWTDDMMAVWSENDFAAWRQQPKIIVTVTYTHSHVGRDAATDIVSDLVAGNIVKLRSKDSGSFEVEYPDGRVAYVALGDAMPLKQWIAGAQDTPERIIETAKRFKGVPYLWGGTSAKALDCSGFTKTVYFLNGVLLPRD
ncbi:MAG: C40 family peptidase, partial [Ignavibacteriae bacterium]|nr:C40 family peptidase [Ignavibacteriota bacterium]